MSLEIWGIVGIQTAVQLLLLVVLLKLSAIITEGVNIIRSVDRRLTEDSKEHIKIIERLSAIDGDVKELRRRERAAAGTIRE